jgi:hypothetical protein
MSSIPPPFALLTSFVHLISLDIDARHGFNNFALLVKSLDINLLYKLQMFGILPSSWSSNSEAKWIPPNLYKSH